MIKRIFVSVSVIICLVVLTGCPKPINIIDHTKYNTLIDALTLSALDPVIQKNDLLDIKVSVNGGQTAQEIVALYNNTGKNQSNLISAQGFLVEPNGMVTIPAIGEIQAAGKTKKELKELLFQKYKVSLIAPVITIRIINYTVYVEGEVQRPGPIEVNNEIITLQQALATAGGTTPYATLNDVLVIRSNYGSQKIAHIDLRKDEIYTTKSEFYYLKQGDQIIINPNKEKIATSNNSTSRTITYASTAITILLTMFTLLK